MTNQLIQYDCRDENWEKLFIDALDKTSFEGVTVGVIFD